MRWTGAAAWVVPGHSLRGGLGGEIDGDVSVRTALNEGLAGWSEVPVFLEHLVVSNPSQNGQAVVETAFLRFCGHFENGLFRPFEQHGYMLPELFELGVTGPSYSSTFGPAKLYPVVPSGSHSISRS